MRVLIFGAAGRTGRHLTAMAAARGLQVLAAGRDPERLQALAGAAGTVALDLFNEAEVVQAVQRLAPDAIISTIGAGPSETRMVDEVGNNAISNAAAASGVRRVLQVSSLACGDSRAYASERIIAAIGPVLDAKTRAEDHLRRLDLDWTIIRPGGLTEGEPTGNGALYDDPRVHGRISRADLAEMVLKCLDAPGSNKRVLATVDRTTLPPEPADLREFQI
jgi:uncharacterized protein YbjT (DUF2867 family)